MDASLVRMRDTSSASLVFQVVALVLFVITPIFNAHSIDATCVPARAAASRALTVTSSAAHPNPTRPNFPYPCRFRQMGRRGHDRGDDFAAVNAVQDYVWCNGVLL